VIGEILGPTVQLVDSGEATAEVVGQHLSEEHELAPSRAAHVQRSYFVTDVPDSFRRVSARFLGSEIPHAEQVDLSYQT
jgi:glutamate racemase